MDGFMNVSIDKFIVITLQGCDGSGDWLAKVAYRKPLNKHFSDIAYEYVQVSWLFMEYGVENILSKLNDVCVSKYLNDPDDLPF